MTALLWGAAAVAFIYAPILAICAGLGAWLGGAWGAFIGGFIGFWLQAAFNG